MTRRFVSSPPRHAAAPLERCAGLLLVALMGVSACDTSDTPAGAGPDPDPNESPPGAVDDEPSSGGKNPPGGKPPADEPAADDPADDPDDPTAPTPVTAKLPGRSSSLALTSDDRYLVVVNRQNDSVSVIEVRDEYGDDVQHLIAEVGVGKEPRYVALSPDDSKAYVSNTVDGTVSVIDLKAKVPEVIGDPIPVGTEPRGLVTTPNGKYLYVANHTEGTVSVIRTKDRYAFAPVWVGGNPQAIAVTNDGDTDDRDESLLVTRFFSEVIDEARPDGFNDAKQGVVKRFTVAASLEEGTETTPLYIRPLQNSGFVADRRQFCLETRRQLEENGDVVFFNSGADGIPDNDTQGAGALKNETFCPDPASTDASAEGPIAKDVQGVYPNQLYAALVRDNWLFVPNVGASPEPPVKFNVNVQALVSCIRLNDGTDFTTNLNDQIKTEPAPAEEEATRSLAKLFGNDVVAIDADITGKKLLIVSRGGNYVMRASLEPDGSVNIGAPNDVVRFQTGNLPSGVVMSLDGARAYTNNEVNTSVTAIDLEYDQVLERDIHSSEPPKAGTQKHRNVAGKLAFFTALGIPDTLDTYGDDGQFDIELRDIVPLSFRNKASDNAWSSCSSCHEDGHSDNVTWIFPTGPRQTVALEGTFNNDDPTDQRILNWNGVRGSVTDFNNNSRGVQGGKGFATDVHGVDRSAEIFNHGPTEGISDALDAMTEWVANAVRAPIMPDVEEVDSYDGDGARKTFAEVCASCHGGAKWTKSTIAAYANNPTFEVDPLGAQFFQGVTPLDPNLSVLGPQINALLDDEGNVLTQFLENVDTLDGAGPLEIRGAGAIAGQSTQGFGSLGGAGFNVPSLLGVGYHAPFLHDGSAETLEEVFERHTIEIWDGTMPIADALPPAELDALEKFLESIDDDTPTF